MISDTPCFLKESSTSHSSRAERSERSSAISSSWFSSLIGLALLRRFVSLVVTQLTKATSTAPPRSARDADDDEITPLSRRDVRRVLVYVDTKDHTGRAVGRRLRASGRDYA